MLPSSSEIGVDEVEVYERALLAHPSVLDCAVLVRNAPTDPRLFVFVVATTPGQEERIVASTFPDAAELTVVPMRSLPYRADGTLDRECLDHLGVVGPQASARVEAALAARGDLQQVVAIATKVGVSPRRLHSADLVPHIDDATGPTAVAQAPLPVAATVSDVPALVQVPGVVMPADAPSTLGPTLVRAAARYSDPRITYVSESGSEVKATFQDVLSRAERILGALRSRAAAPGQYVLLQLSSPADIVPMFWGCVLGGLIPVICPLPPSYGAATNELEKLLHVWRLLGKPLIVAEGARRAEVAALVQRLDGAGNVVVIDDLVEHAPDASHHVAAPSDVAFLALTSGSTGAPKCIALTHANLLSRARGTNVLCEHTDADVILNWLPFDHIGSISDWHVRCVDLGCHMVYCTKERVLGEPLNWLRLIARYRITHSWAPNFAYALINSALDSARAESWDLSCMKSLLTAGEAVSSTTVEEFLTRLSHFGLARSAVRPAFGMAELGSGITYFRPTLERPYAALSFDRRSLTGTLVPAAPDNPQSISFTCLGTVIAGMAMRIVDDEGKVVPENTIGYLHVSGEAVTPGYVNNPEANAQVFVGDGWFDTGDRGFIAGAQLYLTGRSKDTIIVNGANYYPGEIESAAEQVPGILVSFTAACSVRPAGAREERVALFLCHDLLPERRVAELLREVQARVGKKIGVKPDYIIPLTPQQIPKTGIGKIQRKELARRFEQGEFTFHTRAVDALLENENTLPNWFFRPIWRATELRGAELGNSTAQALERLLVLAPASGTAQRFLDALPKLNADAAIVVVAGATYERRDERRVTLNWNDEQQLSRLCTDLSSTGFKPSGVVDLAACAALEFGEWTDLHCLEADASNDAFRVLGWIKALHAAGLLPNRYWTVACGAQGVVAGDRIQPSRALSIPLLKSLEQSIEGFVFRHIDVSFDELSQEDAPVALWPDIVRELSCVGKSQEVALRDAARLVLGLELVDWAPARNSETLSAPFAVEGEHFVLVTGGLGGVGSHVVRLLIQRGARVLIIGRRAREASADDVIAELAASGRILYRQADVADLAQVRRAVEDAKSAWNCDLGGVVHLAASAREAPVLDETRSTLAEVLRPKAIGAQVVDAILEQYPAAYCVLFSSAATTIGTSQTGAYAMANAWLDVLAHEHRRKGRSTWALNWSPWAATGMNANLSAGSALRSKGLESVSVRQGLTSLQAAVTLGSPRVIIGLLADHPLIAAQLRRKPFQADVLDAYCTRVTGSETPLPSSVEVVDESGCPLSVSVTELARLPSDNQGNVDRAALEAMIKGAAREKRAPKTDAERRLCQIFQRVLSLEDVGAGDSFFDLGGTSLLSLRLFGAIEAEFGTRLPAATLLDAPTPEALAARLGGNAAPETNDCLVPLTTSKGPAIFLVHDADGETLLYRGLAQALNGASVFGLQPHRANGFPALHTSIAEMSDHYIARMREVQPRGPYLLGGMCAGGVIAFDMACKLQAMGEQVGLVVLLDAVDSQAPRVESSAGRAERFFSLFSQSNNVRSVLYAAQRKLTRGVLHVLERRVHRAKNTTRVLLLQQLQKHKLPMPGLLAGIPPRIVYEYAQAHHAPKQFSGSLLLFRATKADAEFEIAGRLSDTPAIQTTADPLLGWGQRATRGVEVIDVPGGHSSMLREPNVGVLASALQERIARAVSGSE